MAQHNKFANAVASTHTRHPASTARDILLSRLGRLSYDIEQVGIMEDAIIDFEADATKYNRDFIQKGKNWDTLYASIKKEKDELKKEKENKKKYISVDIAAFEKKVKELKEFHQLEVKIGINTKPKERDEKIAKLEELIVDIKKKRGITNPVAPLSVESKAADPKKDKSSKAKPDKEPDENKKFFEEQARGEAARKAGIEKGMGLSGRPAKRDIADASLDELGQEIEDIISPDRPTPDSPFIPRAQQLTKKDTKTKPAVNQSNKKDDGGCSCNIWAMLFGNSNQSTEGYKRAPETPSNRQGQKR